MADRLHTPLCEMLGIEYPIVLAGMAAGGGAQSTAPTPVKLVAAVTNAGGLGVMGDNFGNLDDLDAGIKELRSLVGDRPFGVDFLLPATRAEITTSDKELIYAQLEKDHPKHVAVVEELIKEHGLDRAGLAPSEPMSTDLLNRKIEVLLDNKVPVFAAALGDPAMMTERAHDQGMKVIGMAGAVRHAERHVAANVDIITAQGTEAGGHTGYISTMVLVPQVVDAVAPMPVLAAGGIGSGRHLATALALGAQGAWVGTAFLTSEETNIPEDHQQQILGGRSSDFTTSKFMSGKNQRSYNNAVKQAWAASGLENLEMPLQGILQEPFTRAAREAGRYDLVGNPSGQISGMLNERRPAKDILMDMVNEARDTISGLQKHL
ncbi:MAG: nitronate monooxygenase [SAR202 cluster bacterium]|nr:nitronate monooxygenase [SAR202 cluster bacterium]MDP6716377.1 nitronate monooxygenase [SAR202 cluster bacterium]